MVYMYVKRDYLQNAITQYVIADAGYTVTIVQSQTNWL